MNFNIKENKLETTLPLLAYENSYLISKSSDITRLFKIELKEAYTISNSELNNSHLAWCKAIRCLPDYCIVHKQDIFCEKKLIVYMVERKFQSEFECH